MADKTVRFIIDAHVWNTFRAQALMRGETAQAGIVNLVTRDVKEKEQNGSEHHN
jgi:hypothetical protein